MVDIAHANAYSEVIEILKYIPIEDYNKIPKERIEVLEQNANKDWKFNYNPNLTLNEQNISKIAKTVIAILFRDYWATEEQRGKIKAKERYDIQKIEEEKQKKYNTDNLFKKYNSINDVQEKSTIQEVAMVKYKENIFKKIVNKIKNIFSKKQ